MTSPPHRAGEVCSAFPAEEPSRLREIAVHATNRFDAADAGFTLTTTEEWPHDSARAPQQPARAHLSDRKEQVQISAGAWLNGVLADRQVLSALSRKHHRVARATAPHLADMLARHAEQQLVLAEELAERIHLIGGVAAADPRHVAELTSIPPTPDGAEPVPSMIARLLQAHDISLRRARAGTLVLRERGDRISADLLESRVMDIAEKQLRELLE